MELVTTNNGGTKLAGQMLHRLEGLHTSYVCGEQLWLVWIGRPSSRRRQGGRTLEKRGGLDLLSLSYAVKIVVLPLLPEWSISP